MKNRNLTFFAVMFLVLFLSNISAQPVSTPQSNEYLPRFADANRESAFLSDPGSDFQISNIKIIESQSITSGHDMDTIWRYVAQGLGHNAVIVPQTALDDTTFFSTTNILIVSSGVIPLPENRINTIKSFIMTGKNVYLQCEYLASYQTNQAFATLVNSLGGTFSWDSTVNGDISPMQILGTISNTPNNIPSINYFWYGVYGTGNNTIEYFMRKQGKNYGFVFTPANPGYGIIIAQTDQDWIRTRTSIPLMQNILARLGTVIGIQPISTEIPASFSLSQNYPNPFNPTTNFEFRIADFGLVNLTIYDAMGRTVETLQNGEMKPGVYKAEWNASGYPSGVYFYKLSTGSFSETKKMVLVK